VEKNSQDISKMKKKRKSSKSAKKNSEQISKLVLNGYEPEITPPTGNVQTGFSCTICRPSVMFQTNEDRGKHMSEYHPYSLDIDFGTDSTINCPLCEDESFSNSFEGRQKYNQHIEDIHMTWIAPETSSSANENQDDKSQSENKEIPIIPFSSVILLEAENSNELEPWRRKFGKDCNKVAATGSRPLKCPICPSFFTKLSISEYKCHMIRGKRNLRQNDSKKTEIDLEHNYKRGLKCQKCKKQFKTLSEFVLHTKEHPHKPFICEHCHISFKSKRELNQHRSSHEHKDLVEKASSGPGGLKKKEISNFKTKNRKVIKCPSCDFKCSNLNELGKIIKL